MLPRLSRPLGATVFKHGGVVLEGADTDTLNGRAIACVGTGCRARSARAISPSCPTDPVGMSCRGSEGSTGR